MAGRKHSRGICAHCGLETTKAAMTRHHAKCPQLLAAIEEAGKAQGERETLLLLRVQDAYLIDFWLDLEMRGDAKLKKLDDYLRAIWLECCGHMSEFSGGGWGSVKVGMNRSALDAFQSEGQLTHIYDFGTSSETQIKVLAVRQGRALTKHPIALLARNKLPEVVCCLCKAAATHMCLECMEETEGEGFLCDEHAQNHPHDDYGEPLALVNSPRLGLCGYDGPAEPPY